MEDLRDVGEKFSQVEQPTQSLLQQTVQAAFKGITLKKLRGGFLLALGYLLSPLCWWNDLIFNLPVAYCFGYICSLFSPNLLLPCSVIGYWLSNVAGILLMQFGVVDVVQEPSKGRNFKKDLWMGVATSTVYTLLIVGLVQFKILDVSMLLPIEKLTDLSTFLPW